RHIEAEIGLDEQVFEFLQRLVVELALGENAGNAFGKARGGTGEPLAKPLKPAKPPLFLFAFRDWLRRRLPGPGLFRRQGFSGGRLAGGLFIKGGSGNGRLAASEHSAEQLALSTFAHGERRSPIRRLLASPVARALTMAPR